MSERYLSLLSGGLAELGIELEDSVQQRLLAYHALLIKWNKAYNLTSVRKPEQMITRHLLDSLSILPFVGPGDLLDVGTGPGLPGMILALVQRDRAVTLLDSNGKKTRFLTQVKMELGVDNVTVVHSRLETWQPGQTFSQITSRAFATLADMVAKSHHLLAPGGHFLAMKGLYPTDEIAALPGDCQVDRVTPLTVPGSALLSADARHLVQLSARTT
jgi:16S rRNA (guanine527-N7)-methyltransferase